MSNTVSRSARRVCDLAVAVPALAVASVPMLFVMAAVRITMGNPVFFTQERLGLNGKPFKLYKIRSMTIERKLDGELLHPKDRLTRLGTLLRKTGIDELPQLWNIVKGEMTLVGPRPLPACEGSEIPGFRQRLAVKPGVVCLAKLHESQGGMLPEEKLHFDLEYIRRRNPFLDLYIIFRTAAIVVTGGNEHLPERAWSSGASEKPAGKTPDPSALVP